MFWMVLEILAVKTELKLFKKYDVWSLVTLLLLGLYALFLIYSPYEPADSIGGR
jgi:hypothetical protein